jgi:DNA-directed RNA polymerase subunit F
MKTANGTGEEWTDAKNERRCELIDRKFDGPPLTPTESAELAQLQEEMLRYRQRVAPLPIEDARRLHQELLAQAGGPESAK